MQASAPALRLQPRRPERRPERHPERAWAVGAAVGAAVGRLRRGRFSRRPSRPRPQRWQRTAVATSYSAVAALGYLGGGGGGGGNGGGGGGGGGGFFGQRCGTLQAHERYPHMGYLNRRSVVHIAVQSRARDAVACGPVDVEDFMSGRRWHERLVQLHHTDAGTFSTASRPLPPTCPTRRRLQRTRSMASGHNASLLGEHPCGLSADGRHTIAKTPAMLDALLGPSPIPLSAESPGQCSPSAMPGATAEARSHPQGGPWALHRRSISR